MTQHPRSYFVLGLLAVALGTPHGCTRATCARPQDETVALLLADLWTPDKEVEQAALVRAAQLKDPRIGEALVGKMWSDVVGYHPTYPYAELVVDALRAQGFQVELEERGYRVTWPNGPLSELIPYSRPPE